MLEMTRKVKQEGKCTGLLCDSKPRIGHSEFFISKLNTGEQDLLLQSFVLPSKQHHGVCRFSMVVFIPTEVSFWFILCVFSTKKNFFYN